MNKRYPDSANDQELERLIVDYVQTNSPSSIEGILNAFPDKSTRDALYQCLADFRLFVRIEVQELTDEAECLVFPDLMTAYAWEFKDREKKKPLMIACLRKGASFELNGETWKVIDTFYESNDVLYECGGEVQKVSYKTFESLIRDGDLTPVVEEDLPRSPLGLSAGISADRLNRARERMDTLQNYLNGNKKCSRATYYRLKKCWRKGGELGQPLLGFVPEKRPGNKAPRHSSATIDFVSKYVLANQLGIKKIAKGTRQSPGKKAGNVSKGYEDYKIQATKHGLDYVGLKKFYQLVNEVPLEKKERASKGFRAANAVKLTGNDDHAYEREAEYAGEMALIDCTKKDVLLKLEDGRNIKLVVSRMIDVYSSCVTGYAVSVKGSSRRLLMSTIRDHAAQFNYLPQKIFYDKGPDYTSHANYVMAKDLGIQIDFCPTGAPRVRFQIERSFRTEDIDFVHNLPGSTKFTNQPRKLSKGYRPEDEVSISLFEFFSLLEQSINDYNQTINSSLGTKGKTPLEAFHRSRNDPRRTKAQLNEIIDRKQIYAATLLPVAGSDGTRRNQGGYVQHQNRDYFCEELTHEKTRGQRYRVRWDQHDPRRVFVEVGEEWVEARCRNYAYMACWSEMQTRCNALEMFSSNSRFGISMLRAEQVAQRTADRAEALGQQESKGQLDDAISYCADEGFRRAAFSDEDKAIPDKFQPAEILSEDELEEAWDDDGREEYGT
jgi:transposase InsO family protein